MKEYEQMNIFDMASLLQQMLHDEELHFHLVFNDRVFNFYRVEATNGVLELHARNPRIELKDIDVKSDTKREA